MATNDRLDPNDPRRPHAGDDPLDPRPASSTDPYGTRPGEVRGDPLAPGGTYETRGPDPTIGVDADPAYRADPVAHRTDTYGDRTTAGRAGTGSRSGSTWAWAIGAVVVLAAALAFFLSDGYTARDVPATGTIQEPATQPVPIDPQPDTPVTPAEPLAPQ